MLVRVQSVMRQQKAMTARMMEDGVGKKDSQERRQMVLGNALNESEGNI